MTQYSGNPNMTANTTGWSVSGGGTLTATVDGGRYVSSSGTGRSISYYMFNIPDGIKPILNGMNIRRNTAASYSISRAQFGAAFTADTVRDMFTPSPVGAFVTYPSITYASTVNSGTGTSIILYFPDNVPIDVTIKGVNIYDTTTAAGASAVIDGADAAWTATLSDNSKTISVKHNAANNEAFNSLSWNWGDGTAATSNPRTNVFSAVTHTYATAGIYTVTATATNYAGQTTTSVQTLTVPSGTFTSDFTYQANYLGLDVDASAAVAPSNDPIDSYTWVWGDGTPDGTGKLASHTYAQEGTYNVTLTIKTNETLRTSSATKAVVMTSPPSTTNYFNISKKLLEVSFTPSIQDGTSYSWSFGDGGSSTEKQPTHTYSIPGTYSVTLTVNGTLNTTQSVMVTDVYTPLGKLNDQLRLEVAVPKPAGSLFNLLHNPSGFQGSYEWLTPLAGSSLVGQSTTDTPKDKGIPGAKLIYSSGGSGAQTFYSEAQTVTQGQYVGAQFVCPYVDGYYQAQVETLDVAGTVVASGTLTGFLNTLGVVQRTPTLLVSAPAVRARVRFWHYSNTSSGTPAVNQIVQMRRVMLAQAPAAATLTTNPYADFENWQNLLGPTSSIQFRRATLDVGTFQATVLDSGLDPAISDTIRPGQGVRFRANTSDAAGNVVLESLWTGTLTAADVSYSGKGKASLGAKDVKIALSATDNITPLTQTAESRGVALITELPELLEGKGVPFEVNGSSGQVSTVQIVTANENASTLDQIAVTRDSNAGYVHVNRNNVLVARDPEHMPTVPVGMLDEEAYSQIDATFGTSECMNSITVKWLRTTAATADTEASTEEITYGPYEDLNSIATWGRYSKTFTMQGSVENPAIISAKAQTILDANSIPVRHINSITVPIRYKEDLNSGKALLDVYDLVRLKYGHIGTDTQVRVAGVQHKITPSRWLMTVEFAPVDAVASPQVVASPPAPAAATTGPGPLVQAGSTTITPSAANTVTSKVITFATAYESIPNVTVSPSSTVPNTLTCSVGAISTTGFTIYMTRTNTTTTGFCWIAVGD